MELGSLIWFSSRKHPFAVRERHCLDLRCECTDAWLTFSEVALSGEALPAPLSFEIRVNLRDGRERRGPPRPAEVEALVREFLVRFPDERFQEMVRRRQEQRTAKRRLETYPLEHAEPGLLLCYSEVVSEQGGVAKSGRRFSFFFHHQGRDYLLEDHYCPTPGCDCRQVHVEFWERVESDGRTPRVDVLQQWMALFQLEGKFERLEFTQEDPRVAERVCRAWREQCGHQLEEFRRRYQQLKALGQHRLGPSSPIAAAGGNRSPDRVPSEPLEVTPIGGRVGRNEPCPCGSGEKFKRCCGRGKVRG